MQPGESVQDWPSNQDPSLLPPDAFRDAPDEQLPPLRIKIPLKAPAMAPNTRSSTRQRTVSNASGSEYHESNASQDADEDMPPAENNEPEEPEVEYTVTSRGRKIARPKSYKESASEDEPIPAEVLPSPVKHEDSFGDDEDDEAPHYRTRSRTTRPQPKLGNFIVSDDEGGATVGRYNTRNRSKNTPSAPMQNGIANGGRLTRRSGTRPQASSSRVTRRMSARKPRSNGQTPHDEEGYVDEGSSGSVDADGSFDDAVRTSSEPEPDDDIDADGEPDIEGDLEPEPEQDGRPYALRQRAKINYAIPPPLEEMPQPPKPRSGGGRASGRTGGGGRKVPGWSATGAELSRWMGGGGDDSDSDHVGRTPRKPFGATGGMGGVFAGGAGASGGLFASDLAAAAGTPSNLGKVGDAILADADPLGVNQNVTFDEVGGLDDHINSLKEMTLLPLLYPEVFQQFGVTPPRGVLFHGPPGTGKTLLARALAASCRSNGKSISFFMRKGADCLSKWVGEAERQLRLLFEEARNQQPSIIFFDEIDGLAPVRSSKQDQIHASIVSTLLALMDGMDGRGQVIVIGATNRPDAIDPALRRPGRFDREFYFPLPTLEARERILRIMTKKWAGWESEKGEENVRGLAKLTKGYGGADLRALCTETALNAVQRRYPQIYKTNDRLLLKPETIEVELRDFMIAIKKLVPSSARSISSAASPLPQQLVPLLQTPYERAKDAIAKVLPVSKKRTALEEAEWEDESNEGALERELMMQSMETLRVYRPRVVLYGSVGMGQEYVAAAVLHHLEGYHVQSLDLGTLMGDSTRTTEAAIVQLFVEAKRHQPSVIYIPSLVGWSAAVSETTRTTVRAMLDTLAPTDPILLLAVVDGSFSSLPRDVRGWFGSTRENRIEIPRPIISQREEFFEGLLSDLRRPPNHFPDGIKRRKRVLEELPIAPPLEPRQPTAAELAVQEDNDQRVVTLLKYRLGPILQELKRKFKRFTKRAVEEYNYDFDAPRGVSQVDIVTTSVEVRTDADGVIEVLEQQQEQHTEQVVEQPQPNGINGNQEPPPAPALPPEPELFDVDLERMHVDLYRNKYLTPDDFLDDIRRIVHNAQVRMHEDPERLFRAKAMLTAAEVSINDFDPSFRLECQRMASRERKRREEYRKKKEEEKMKAAAENGRNGTSSQVYAPGTRRSARHNGQQPEISITDPLQLERKLKRQRSTSAAATPSDDESGERGQKRSRLASEDNEHDPLDLLGSALSPERQGSVRFADQVERAPTPPQDGQILVTEESVPSIEPLRRNGGFDPSLLNPLPSPGVAMAGPSTIAIDAEHNPFLSPFPYRPEQGPDVSTQFQPQFNFPPVPEAAQLLVLPVPSPELPVSEPPAPLLEQTAVSPTEQLEQAADVSMEEPRPTTPLPDFFVDDALLSTLKHSLCDSTAALNVEELEQLRATCLSCVWRHRTEWDRTSLIHELMHIVQEFVHEVSLDEMES